MAYIRDAAVIGGFAAHALDRLIGRRLPDLVQLMPPDRAREVDAALRDLRRAAEAYLATPVSVDGHADIDSADIGPSWTEDLIDTATAATILGLTERQARRLAATGLGVKVRRVWMFDRTQVYAERRHRADSE